MFKFSKYGVKNISIYFALYGDFINWCKTKVKVGTFSTYTNGEPVCFSEGIEIPYRSFSIESQLTKQSKNISGERRMIVYNEKAIKTLEKFRDSFTKWKIYLKK